MPIPDADDTNTAIIDLIIATWRPLLGPNGNGETLKFSTLKSLTVMSPDLPGKPGQKLVRPSPKNSLNLQIFAPAYLKFRLVETTVVVVEPLARFYPVGISYYRQDSNGKNEGFRRATDIDSLPRSDIRFGSDVNPVAGGPGIPWVRLWDNHGEANAKPDDGSADWEYFLIIQDNFGSIGAIDPEIENEIPD